MKKNKNIFIFGNAGSGKSYLARHLSQIYQLETLHLDHISFLDKHYTNYIDLKDRLNSTQEFIAKHKNGFIIEGVYDDILINISSDINTLIFLDLPWEEAEKGLRDRNFDPQMTSKKKHEESKESFIAYAKKYYERKDFEVCQESHDYLFNSIIVEEKIRLKSREEVNEFINAMKSS